MYQTLKKNKYHLIETQRKIFNLPIIKYSFSNNFVILKNDLLNLHCIIKTKKILIRIYL